MGKSASWPGLFRVPFKFIGDIFHRIIRYLSCCDCETTDDRTLLRKLYNAGYLDEGKYHQFREQCLEGSFDPEEIRDSFPT